MSIKNYVCPMHPEIASDKPGKCSICGMNLVNKASHPKESEVSNYKPLLTIVSLIFLVSLIASGSSFDGFMRNFMAGFFLVFAGFKLLDLKGFADGYSSYDLLARRLYVYGYIYPFIEFVFGVLYMLRMDTVFVNLAVFVVMAFSGVGVLESMLKKRKFQCACLGTIIKVPLSEVTLVEDFGMALMALMILFSK